MLPPKKGECIEVIGGVRGVNGVKRERGRKKRGEGVGGERNRGRERGVMGSGCRAKEREKGEGKNIQENGIG